MTILKYNLKVEMQLVDTFHANVDVKLLGLLEGIVDNCLFVKCYTAKWDRGFNLKAYTAQYGAFQQISSVQKIRMERVCLVNILP